MLDRLVNSDPFVELLRLIRSAPDAGPIPPVWADGMWGSAAPIVCAGLIKASRDAQPDQSDSPERARLRIAAKQLVPPVILLVVAHLDQADDAVEDAELFLRTSGDADLANQSVGLLPGWASEPDYSEASDEIAAERLSLCRQLAEAFPKSEPKAEARGCAAFRLIVAPAQALQQPVPRPALLSRSTLALRVGQEISPDVIAAWLTDHGFARVELVDVPGDFAVRGGIVDVFPAGDRPPVRIDFFGDQIESIRTFEVDSQRSNPQGIDEVELFGGLKVSSADFADRADSSVPPLPLGEGRVAESPGRREGALDNPTRSSSGRDSRPPSPLPLAQGERGNAADDFCSFLDYLPDGSVIVFSEPGEIEELGRAYVDRSDDATGLYPIHSILSPSERLRQVMAARFAPEPAGGPVVRFGFKSLQRFETPAGPNATPAEIVAELMKVGDEQGVVVFCDNPAEQHRLVELIEQQRGTGEPRPAGPPGSLTTKLGFLHAGFSFPAGGFTVVGHHEIFHRYATRHRVRRVQAGRPIDSMLDLQTNDYVVHVTHGIAKFLGVKMLTKAGRTEEYLTLRFADHAALHVPASQIHLVHKYVGAFRGHPKLSKLGSRVWERKKAQVSEALMDLAGELLETQARRQAQPGVAYPPDSPMQKEFEDSFIYQETEDQLLTLRQIKKDLQSPRPMDRLLCGDVGYGKTELAVRAAFKVAEGGKQSAVLVPTTVLAEQHERTFRERLADYPLVVEAISRFRTGRQAKDILARTRSGQVDVLIGTHRLLSDDVDFRDLGLVVIDEEQRFGVAHKEKLKLMRATVDVLTMTATPIPRTLHMALLGLRDISALQTPPMDRRAIHTEVVHFNREQLRSAVIRELNRDGQIYFVHNRVHSIQGVADRLRQIVPEARIIIGHGQMHGRELEDVMLRFIRREADILLCTTIIESGVDIPNVNTIFIHEADQFGLAELHQLRGRVGRYKHKAYCYLILPERRPVTPTAARRLKAIEEYSELGAGFRIALRDLEIRGAGNILGPEQSGHIAAVGYELYCQLLDQAVRKLRGEPAEATIESHLELGIGGHLPRDYIPSDRQRMEVYRRLARCRNDEDLTQLEADLIDAYGELPAAARNLLDQAQLRMWASAARVRSIITQPPDLIFDTPDTQRTATLLASSPGKVRVIDERTVHLRLTDAYFEPSTMLAVLRRLLRPKAPVTAQS